MQENGAALTRHYGRHVEVDDGGVGVGAGETARRKVFAAECRVLLPGVVVRRRIVANPDRLRIRLAIRELHPGARLLTEHGAERILARRRRTVTLSAIRRESAPTDQ